MSRRAGRAYRLCEPRMPEGPRGEKRGDQKKQEHRSHYRATIDAMRIHPGSGAGVVSKPAADVSSPRAMRVRP